MVVGRVHVWFQGFMFIGNCFVVTISSHNIKTTWVRRKQKIVAKVSDYKWVISLQYDIRFRMYFWMIK